MKRIITLAMLGMYIFVFAACAQRKPAKTGAYDPKIVPGDFVEAVDNKYFTLKAGRTLVYEGQTAKGRERNEVTVLKRTKKVVGVKTKVVWDRVWLNGELIEATRDWYAQDKKGNVWYFGEDSREYENGKFTSAAGSWEAGVDGAKPGIIMKADPKAGDEYRQEYYKGKAEDMGEVVSLNQTVAVPYGTFGNCLKTRDWTPLDPKSNEYKYYSPRLGGVVLERAAGGGDKVELVAVRDG